MKCHESTFYNFCESDEDKSCLRTMFTCYREAKERFEKALSTPKERREVAALDAMCETRRNWWRRHGVNGELGIAETLHQHIMGVMQGVGAMQDFAQKHGYDMSAIDWDKVKAILEVHDLAEALTTDFTPEDDIGKDMKRRFERIALRIIFEADPARLEKVCRLCDEYDNRSSPEALIAKDIDKLDSVHYILERVALSTVEKKHLLSEVISNTEPLVQTETGKLMLEDIKTNTDHYLLAYKDANRLPIFQQHRTANWARI